MSKSIWLGTCCVMALAGGWLSASTALAQPAPNQPSSPHPAAKAAPALTEVVVTAQRRAERLREVPVTVTAISAATLTQANIKTLQDISKVTPGLRFDDTGVFVQPTIRGIGTSFVTSGGLGNVGIYVDGFYDPNPLGSDFQFANVQNVQVLKGPQGTLFGRNTTGGAILVTTSKPTTTPTAIFQVSYGSFNDQRYQGYASAGITNNLAVDVEGLYHSSDGFQHDITTGNQRVGAFYNATIRTGIKYDMTDDISWLFRYTHVSNDDPTGNAANAYVLNGVPLSAALHPSLEALFGVPKVATAPNETASAYPMLFHYMSNSFQLTGTDDLGFGTLTSYTQFQRDQSFQTEDLDYSSSPVFTLALPNIEKTTTQEFLLNSKPGSRLQWTAGAFYFNYLDSYPGTGFGEFGSPPAVGANSSTTTMSVAAFADVTYQVLKSLFITGGIRYSHDEVNDAFFSTFDSAGQLVPTHVSGIKANSVTPRFVIRYKPTDESSVYFSFTRGYKPGLLNVGGGTLTDINIAPEHINAYELGFKYGTPKLSFDLSTYYYDYSNLQVSSYNGLQSLLTNAANARIYGLEGDVDYHFIENLDVNAAFDWNDAEYSSFPTAPFYDLKSPFLYNIIQVPNGATGQEMQQAPKFTANGGIRYQMDILNGHASASANVYYTSKFFFDPAGQFLQGSYTTLGLRLQWTPDKIPVTFALYGDNVTDARYRTQVLPGTFGFGSVWAYPATVGFSIRYKY